MNKPEAKRDACSIAASLIDNYMDVGQPMEDCATGTYGGPTHKPTGPDDCRDCDRVTAALTALRNELERRSGK